MPPRDQGAAAKLAARLAREAETVCRHYLPNGHREGRYWLVGDVENTPGRSLFVRLTGPDRGKGAAGKWTDAATGDHGDLLDLIRANRRLETLSTAMDEARDFLRLPRDEADNVVPVRPAVPGSVNTARRLWASAHGMSATVAEAYLHSRGLIDLRGCGALRCHLRCWYRPAANDASTVKTAYPALIAAVRDAAGELTGVHRTWLDPDGRGKAPVATPRRAMGHLLGHAVWFGRPGRVLAAGEGIETMLSLRQALPLLPSAAALSAAHLAALNLPAEVRRLYIVRDSDPAGQAATAALDARAREAGVETRTIASQAGDLNEDLQRGRDEFAAMVQRQVDQDDWHLGRDGG